MELLSGHHLHNKLNGPKCFLIIIQLFIIVGSVF